MSHYTIDYSELEGNPIAKHNKAIADIKDYIGEESFDSLTEAFRSQDVQPSLEKFQVIVSFAGIAGYPVKAWYNYCFPL